MKSKDILEIFDIMNIKDVTTDRQKKNGTTVFEFDNTGDPYGPNELRFAEYKTGYVRSLNGYCCYQINKKKSKQKSYTSYDGKTNYYRCTSERILIPKRKDRLEFLLKFLLKNYFGKVRNHVEYKQYTPPSWPPVLSRLQVIIDGEHYTLKGT